MALVLRTLIVAAALALSAWSGPLQGCSETSSNQPFVAAQSARAFSDSVGVNVRLHLTNSTGYGDFTKVRDRLLELGVRHVGDGLCHTCPAHLQRLEALGEVGIKATLGVGNQTDGALRDQRLQVIRERLLGVTEAIVGPNEVDWGGDPHWVSNTRAYQAALYDRVKGDPALRHLPVIGPSLVQRDSRALLGDLSSHLDRGNIHPYPAGIPPMSDLPLEFALAAHVSGNKPLIATETGYHDDTAYTGIHRGASERAIAHYTPRSVLEAFRQGIDRTFLFQFADAWSPAQVQQWNLSEQSNSFGLLRSDQTPKPAFYALRNLLRAVDADSAPVAQPGGLRLDLVNAPPDLRKLLLRSADGSYSLVLWRTVSVWDRVALRDLEPAVHGMGVTFGQPIALARQFNPVDSDLERGRWTNPTAVLVGVGGAPVVLKLYPR